MPASIGDVMGVGGPRSQHTDITEQVGESKQLAPAPLHDTGRLTEADGRGPPWSCRPCRARPAVGMAPLFPSSQMSPRPVD